MSSEEQDQVDQIKRLVRLLRFGVKEATDLGLDVSVSVYTSTKDEEHNVTTFISIVRPILDYHSGAGE